MRAPWRLRAMELYRDARLRPRRSLTELQPLSLGRVKGRLGSGEDDLLAEMLDAR